jgi:Tfp pilus assembly protein PilX
MIMFILKRSQRGVTLLVTLIMLILITIMVTTAFTLSNSNLKSVGNMQFRNEALAAANVAIEQQVSSAANFTNPVAKSISVGSYTVSVAKPACLYVTDVVEGGSADPHANIKLDSAAVTPPTAASPVASGSYVNTYWDIAATVNDGISGALVTAHQGVKITLPSSPYPCS